MQIEILQILRKLEQQYPVKIPGDGDLIHQLDFRRIYATVLSNRLEADSDKILGHSFEKLTFV